MSEAENVDAVGEGGVWLESDLDAQPEDEGSGDALSGYEPEGREQRVAFGAASFASVSGGVWIHCGDARTRTRLAIAVTSWSFLAFLPFYVFFAEHSQLESAMVSPNAYRFY
jgi:hypothetical protein